MKVFVFGAGASKGAQDPNTPKQYQAPLANELFDKIYHESAREVLLQDELIERFRVQAGSSESLEKWLTKKWEDIPAYKSSLKKRTEKSAFGFLTFYVWRVLQRTSSWPYITKYGDFIAKLTAEERDEDFGIINFNYDTLLDQAITLHRKVALTSMHAYLRANYIKPHGSINWFLPKRSSDPAYPREVSLI